VALLCCIRLLSFILSLWITSFDLSLAQLSVGPSQDFFYILLLIARRAAAAAAEAVGNNWCLSVCVCAEQKVLQQQSIAFSNILYSKEKKERKNLPFLTFCPVSSHSSA